MEQITEQSPAQRPVTVAVLDDHQMVAEGIASRLSATPEAIEVVATVTSWGALLAHEAFPVDVVILDLNLEDNIPVSTKIRALSSAGSRAVIISRHADSGSIHGAIQAGAAAFIAKSESAAALTATVLAAAQGSAEHSDAVRRALAEFQNAEDPGLGRQEHRALVLYAAGRSIKEVAHDMDTTEETIKSYIKRARRKYRAIGVDLGTKNLLRRHAIREGWITPE
ncbi:response regulator [Herbiconiux sp. L3-i23]|uniref:response regulator transcription factor n=1 Tax=Herbiconiux sp. L3-i23 TaxID=2905871 RepID=UPI0020573393|nr:response regulator transcription factor [Herbiconiux sp. L3-i23]BDI23293.1 transcriptional regulatory protein LiaR [Herbiconiux sp. L3-i23]